MYDRVRTFVVVYSLDGYDTGAHSRVLFEIESDNNFFPR